MARRWETEEGLTNRAERYLVEAYAHGYRIRKTYWYAVMFEGNDPAGVYTGRAQVWVEGHATEDRRPYKLFKGSMILAAI